MRVDIFVVALCAVGCSHHHKPPPAPAPAAASSTPAHHAAPPDAAPQACTSKNPPGCPAAAPAVNHPCDVVGATCVYDARCCHTITYVCAKNKHFEADFQSCP